MNTVINVPPKGLTLIQHTKNLLERVAVPLADGNVVALDCRRITGITSVENYNQPNSYVIYCGEKEHYHTTSEDAIAQICGVVCFRVIHRTVVTART